MQLPAQSDFMIVVNFDRYMTENTGCRTHSYTDADVARLVGSLTN